MEIEFSGSLNRLINMALNGQAEDIDGIMNYLHSDASIAMTRYIDYALSKVESIQGEERIKFYLFHGSQIQRNYACLYFNRKDEWEPVKKAFEMGLIDEIQAYSR